MVAIVDDDDLMRGALQGLLKSVGLPAQAFASAEEFLASDCVAETRCLILDIAMPRMTGPDLQHELKRRRREIPIVFITAHADESARPRLIEEGAVECLLKPFSDTDLRKALDTALAKD